MAMSCRKWPTWPRHRPAAERPQFLTSVSIVMIFLVLGLVPCDAERASSSQMANEDTLYHQPTIEFYTTLYRIHQQFIDRALYPSVERGLRQVEQEISSRCASNLQQMMTAIRSQREWAMKSKFDNSIIMKLISANDFLRYLISSVYSSARLIWTTV